MAAALERPAGPLTTSPVTPPQLADFRRDPRLLHGKRFVNVQRNIDAGAVDDGRDLGMGPSNELFYEIRGVMYAGSDVVMVLFEGCRVPDERPLAEMLDFIAESELVE
jgi:hypothetical protein